MYFITHNFVKIKVYQTVMKIALKTSLTSKAEIARTRLDYYLFIELQRKPALFVAPLE